MDPHTNSSGNQPIPFFADFGLQGLVDDELNIDQVVALIRGEPEDPINVGVNPHTLISSDLANNDHNNINQFCGISPEDVFTNFNSPTMSCTDSTIFNPFSGFEDDLVKTGGEEGGEDEDSSATYTTTTTTTNNTTTTTTTKKAKVDRSRTLISERRRRGRMKEKLYALRALVPNITKMDKASIVGDAVLYVQDLQMRAKKLKSEVEGLQSSLKAAERRHPNNTPSKVTPTNHFLPVCKNIMQMDVLQIEDREFYVKVVSNKGRGVATSLYKALETFTSFVIQNSNLTTVCERFILTFTLNVGKCRDDLSLPNLKLWLTGAFLKQGFEFKAS